MPLTKGRLSEGGDYGLVRLPYPGRRTNVDHIIRICEGQLAKANYLEGRLPSVSSATVCCLQIWTSLRYTS